MSKLSVDFGLIDTALERARTEGQTLAFRVMADNAGEHADALPDWLLESGVGGLRYRESVGVWLFMPDFDDPLFLDYAERLIDDLALVDGEVDALQDVALAVEGMEIADLEHHAATVPR